MITNPPKPEDADQSGCIKSYNEVAQEFNKQLKEQVSELRTQLPGAALYYIDIYSAKYSLISEANKYGNNFVISLLSKFGYYSPNMSLYGICIIFLVNFAFNSASFGIS